MRPDLPEIKGFLETSFLDWPGKVASVFFLPGCNFRCPYCHNHRLIAAADDLGTWSLEAVLDRLDGFRGWLDGVCVTGGEPTLHPNLPAFLEVLREHGWATKLDTNGSRPAVLGLLLERGLVDAVALDVKAPLEAIPYRRNSGVGGSEEAVRESLRLLGAARQSLEIRTTVHPRLLSKPEVLRLAQQVGALVGAGRERRFTLQSCRSEDTLDPGLRGRPPLEPAAFALWSAEAENAFERARIGEAGSGRA